MKRIRLVKILNPDLNPPPSLRIEYPRKFLINHNKGGEYLVNEYVMSSVSIFFENKFITEKVKQLEVKDKFSERTFKMFLELAHAVPISITLNDAMPLQRLAKEWKSNPIQQAVLNFINKSPPPEVKIAEINDEFKTSQKLPNYKDFTQQEIAEVMKTKSFHKMDIKLIIALIGIAKNLGIDPRDLNSILIEHIKEYSETATVLIEFINMKKLSDSQLEILENERRTQALEPVVKEVKRRSKTKAQPEEQSEAPSPTTSRQRTYLKIKPPYYGLMASIALFAGGDPVLKGAIKVTASSHDPTQFIREPKEGDTTFLIEGDRPFIEFRVPEKISISSYAITNSFKQSKKNWKLFGSNGEHGWLLIDEINDSESIIEPNQVLEQKMDKPSAEYSRFKLELVSYREGRKPVICIKRFEIFNDQNEVGIFAKLQSENKNVLVITSGNDLYKIVNPKHKKKFWYSANEANSFVQFQFLQHRIRPSSYTIKTGEFWHLKSWELYGSCDGVEWFLMDKHRNTNQLNQAYKPSVWKCYSRYYCQFIKLVQVGQTHDNMNVLCMSGMEFFGGIQELPDAVPSQNISALTKPVKSKKSSGFPSPKESPVSARIPSTSPKMVAEKKQNHFSDSSDFEEISKKTKPTPQKEESKPNAKETKPKQEYVKPKVEETKKTEPKPSVNQKKEEKQNVQKTESKPKETSKIESKPKETDKTQSNTDAKKKPEPPKEQITKKEEEKSKETKDVSELSDEFIEVMSSEDIESENEATKKVEADISEIEDIKDIMNSYNSDSTDIISISSSDSDVPSKQDKSAEDPNANTVNENESEDDNDWSSDPDVF